MKKILNVIGKVSHVHFDTAIASEETVYGPYILEIVDCKTSNQVILFKIQE